MNAKLKYLTKERWLWLWRRLGVLVSDKVIEAYNELMEKYAEPHRKYHNAYHIDSCLEAFEEVRELAINPYTLELAIWYHDAVYNIHASDNEERSALLAREVMTTLRILPKFIQEVEEIILATKHSSVPTGYDAKLMLDIDISNMGKPEAFKKVNRLVREEYASVAQERSVEGRSNILEVFLARPRIYLSDYFYEKYEAIARENISLAISELNK